MLSRIKGLGLRCLLVAGATLLAAAPIARAEGEVEKSAYTYSFGTDFTSHFISYGADVWGGGNNMNPFGEDATNFYYGTVTMAMTEWMSGYVNLWADKNNNVPSLIGGQIQEIDVNGGLTFQLGKIGTTVSTGFWNYAGGTEKVVDVTPFYNDGGLYDRWVSGFALNPSINFHYRYDGVNAGQPTGLAVVPAIKPAYTFLSDSKYPLSVSAPISVGIFENGFQGGHGNYGFTSAGVAISVPLKFIAPKFGVWSVSGSLIFYNTPNGANEALPNNPSDDFVVSTLSLGVAM